MSQGTRTILIMAGGTGGHIFPGLAVADLMRERDWRVVWLGNPAGMEARLVPGRGIEMKAVQFGGLRGKGLMTVLRLPFNLARACWQSLAALREVRPAVVLGLGGYITFPAGMMAVLTGRPLVLHEQNSIAGLANRVLAKLARQVMVAFPDALPGARWTGNPVSQSIAAVAQPAARFQERQGPLRILVVGGSLGAQVFNEVVPAAIALLPPDARPIVRHQSGRAHIEALRAAYARAGVQADAVDFIDDMAAAYRDADLVIGRAGAMTVAELACAGVASLLVPFPHAVDDHQTTNARFLANAGAAVMIPQPEFSPQALADRLRTIDRPALLRMAEQARTLGKPDATRIVADVCEATAR